MTAEEKTFYMIRFLLAKSLDNNITEEESGILDELIRTNPQARRYYVEFMQVHNYLRRLHEEEAASRSMEDSQLLDIRLWQELAAYEQAAEAVEVEVRAPRKPAPVPVRATAELKRNRPSKFYIFSLIASNAAMLLMFFWIYLQPEPHRVVATLTDSMNCRWGDKGKVLREGDDVLDEPRILLSGFAALRFDSGTEVVVEGPAAFTPVSTDKLRLEYGKAFARVPGSAIGFKIDTPQSCIIDLGTEFGVSVDRGGGSEVHVYKGKVNLVAGLSDQTKTSEILQQHEARKVDADSGAIRSAEFNEYLFAKTISSKENRVEYGQPVSLTDLVLGGGGFGTSQETAGVYAVSNGQRIIDFVGQYRTIDHSYQTVSSNPFIDGLFVPNGPGQVISSEGHVFSECPPTSGFYFYDLFFDKNSKYPPSVTALYQKRRNLKFAPDVVFMHSNLGFTFDMDAVRRRFPRQSIRRFQTSVGTLSFLRGYTVLSAEELERNYTEFDVWIVVDGQLRAKAERVHWDSLIDLDVPLAANDRFLSIVVTDGGVIRAPGNNANHYDLCGLADMRFEMEAAK